MCTASGIQSQAVQHRELSRQPGRHGPGRRRRRGQAQHQEDDREDERDAGRATQLRATEVAGRQREPRRAGRERLLGAGQPRPRRAQREHRRRGGEGEQEQARRGAPVGGGDGGAGADQQDRAHAEQDLRWPGAVGQRRQRHGVHGLGHDHPLPVPPRRSHRRTAGPRRHQVSASRPPRPPLPAPAAAGARTWPRRRGAAAPRRPG